MSSAAGSVRIAAAVARQPQLWATALRQARRLAPRRWWTRRPFVPLPPAEYLHFRAVTQRGGSDPHVSADDVIEYLRWCRGVER